MCAEPDHADRRASAPPGPTSRSISEDDPARHAWLVGRLDRDVRGALQGLLLWTDRLTAGLEDGGAAATAECLRTVETIRRELDDSLSLVDDLVALGRPGADDSDPPWPRSVVARDLLAAAVREVASVPGREGVDVAVRAVPEDLHFVADPDRSLRAVEGLLRSGLRSARGGERVEVEIDREDGSEGGRGGRPSVRVTLRTPRLPLGPTDQRDALARGVPVAAPDLRRWRAALPFAVAGRCARVLGGTLSVESTGGDGGARAVLRLPSDRKAERRPGWIP